ncbi:MAG: hypothetical protein ACXV5H_08490 [Halobacteriota archaeon]
MQFRLVVIGLLVLAIIGIAVAVAGLIVTGIDSAAYPAWMWIISLIVIIFLTAIIAALLVGWLDSHFDEDAPEKKRAYRDRRR